MFEIQPAYRFPLLIALILHICLIIFLFAHLPTKSYQMPGLVAKQSTEIVQAVAVDQRQIQSQISHIKNQEIQKKAEENERIQQLEAQATAAREARVAEERQVKALQEQQRVMQEQKALEAQKIAAAAAQLKVLQEKKLKEQKATQAAQLKALKEKKEKALKTQEAQLQQKILQQQLSAEQNELAKAAVQSTQQAAAAPSAQQQGEIDRYKAAILHAIGQHWLVPGGANENLSSLYLIQLGPGGVVMNVTLLHSSGDAALDQSAKAAILKSSPLPVPEDPALFDNFRELRLTVSPKTVVEENNEETETS